jgi:AcrR family transcriptional regulator
MKTGPIVKVSFKAQMLQAREDAILRAVSQLLAAKGYEAMTVDEVAAQVGIAKASLYKHFSGKEDLAAAAMVGVLRRARDYLRGLPVDAAAVDQLRAAVRWVLERKLAGELPSLPSRNSGLRAALVADAEFMRGLVEVSQQLGGWIAAAQAQGRINPQLPTTAVLYTLYARACDPVLEFLKLGGQYSDAQIVDLVLSTCFDGLNAR